MTGFSKCSVCDKIITEEDWFDFSGKCEEHGLEEDIKRYPEAES